MNGNGEMNIAQIWLVKKDTCIENPSTIVLRGDKKRSPPIKMHFYRWQFLSRWLAHTKKRHSLQDQYAKIGISLNFERTKHTAIPSSSAMTTLQFSVPNVYTIHSTGIKFRFMHSTANRAHGFNNLQSLHCINGNNNQKWLAGYHVCGNKNLQFIH